MRKPRSFYYDYSLREVKRQALEVAEGLCYPKEVRERIKDAKSEAEVDHILADARQKL